VVHEFLVLFGDSVSISGVCMLNGQDRDSVTQRMSTIVHTLEMRLSPSKWTVELNEGHDMVIETEDEPESMTHVLVVMKNSWSVSEVEFSKLSRYEQTYKQKMSREFFVNVPVYWERPWDVNYLVDVIPNFKSLCVLEL
jgi:hypothetical protein